MPEDIPADSGLEDILVVTTKKTFWASKESKIFPNILYTWILGGKSTDFHNVLILFIRSVVQIIFKKPKLLLIGSAPKLNSWFAVLKRRGFLKNIKLICIGHLEFGYYLVPYFEKIIVHATSELKIREDNAPVKGRYVYAALPASNVEEREYSASRGSYIFSGGRAKRDYKTLLTAMEKVDFPLKLVTRDRECVDWQGDMPANVELQFFKPLDEFLQDVKDAAFVVVPLFRGTEWSHGQTTIVQAMKLGKAIISCRDATVEDYIVDGESGILVEPENAGELQKAIRLLLEDDKLVKKLEAGARKASERFTDICFARRLKEVCYEVLGKA